MFGGALIQLPHFSSQIDKALEIELGGVNLDNIPIIFQYKLLTIKVAYMSITSPWMFNPCSDICTLKHRL